MRWDITGRYVIEAESKEEAQRTGDDLFGHMMETVSVEEEPLFRGSDNLPLFPVNVPIAIGEEGKGLIRSACEMKDGDMRSAKCILSRLEIWELVDGKFPEIGEARLKALQIVVNALGRGRPDE